jgi:hypothetical protein
MAWTAPLTWTANQVLTAAQLNTHLRDNMKETEAYKATGGGGYFVATGVNAIAERQGAHAETAASSTTTSTVYTATLADGITTSVSVNHGTQALVVWSAQLKNSATNNLCMVSVNVSGSTSVTESDNYAVYRKIADGGASYPVQVMHHLWMVGMTPGTSTWKLMYKTPGGTATFQSRRIAVLPY